MVALEKDTVSAIYAEAAAENDSDRRKALGKWAAGSEAERRIAAMISLARSEPGVAVLPQALDANLWALNCLNGTLDLRTGERRSHDPADLITKLAPVEYNPDAGYQLWTDFLETAIPDPKTRRYVQKISGMSLTGDASEDLIVLVHGPGGTGKGTFREAFTGALGNDYAAPADLATFTTRRRDAQGPQPDLARLKRKRLVTISEPKSGGAVSLLKSVTGGDATPTRTHYAETFEFVPQFTLWLMSNYRPNVPADDTGLWRRLREIPFTTVFDPPDPGVRQALSDPQIAGPAVLAWAVEGCLAWQREGLGKLPPQVSGATAEYRKEMDLLADWLEDCTVAVSDAWTSGASLWGNYQSWCDANKVPVKERLGRKGFPVRLSRHFAKDDRRTQRGFAGVQLK